MSLQHRAVAPVRLGWSSLHRSAHHVLLPLPVQHVTTDPDVDASRVHNVAAVELTKISKRGDVTAR